MRPAGVIDQEVRLVGGTEEVVLHAQGFLIASHERYGQIIMLRVYRVELESLLHIPQIHEFVNLTIRVAGNVAKRSVLGRLFVKARDGNNRKELVQGPRVGR